jgi:hypothetical protein
MQVPMQMKLARRCNRIKALRGILRGLAMGASACSRDSRLYGMDKRMKQIHIIDSHTGANPPGW